MIYNYQLNYSMQKATTLNLTWAEHYIISFIIQFFHSGNAEKKVVNNRTFYWLAYALICKSCAPLQIGLERMRQIMNNLCSIGVLDKLKSDSTKKYYAINYSVIMETDEDVIIVPGVDTSLSFYLEREKSTNHFSTIKFNNKIFSYFTPAINQKIILLNLQQFEKSLYLKIKRLLTSQVFSYFKNCTFEIKANEIIIYHTAPIGLIKDNYYKLERAIVDTYINIAFSFIEAPTSPLKPSKELVEFSKLFNNIKIDCELDQKHDLNLLATKIKESSFLKQFSKLSDLLKKYKGIIADQYKDFEKAPQKENFKKPHKRDYTASQLNSLFNSVYDVDFS